MSTLYPDLDLTAFPDGQDQRYVMIDPATPADLTAINSYNSYITMGNMTGAIGILDANPRLVKMLFNAEKWNRHEDMLIALERFYDSDVHKYLMDIVVYRGDWNASATYLKYHVVRYMHDEAYEAYMAVKPVPAGVTPLDSEYWIPITLRGQQGVTGVGLSWRGAWDENVDYYEDDCVAYGNTLYGAVKPSLGEVPFNNTEYWVNAFKIDHTHGVLTYDGRIGSEPDKAVFTTENGFICAGTLPVAAGGTGAGTPREARANLGAAAQTDIERIDDFLINHMHETLMYTAIARADGWVTSGTHFEQEIAVPGLEADCNAIVSLRETATPEQAQQCRGANLRPIAQSTGSLTLAVDGKKPTLDLPISIMMVITHTANKTAACAIVVTAEGWVKDELACTQEIAVPDLPADCSAVVGLSDAATQEQARQCRRANLRPVTQSTGSITLSADGTQPTVDLPMIIMVLG